MLKASLLPLRLDIYEQTPHLLAAKPVHVLGLSVPGFHTHVDQVLGEITTKERKFWRDKTAFREGKPYCWQQKNTQIQQQKKNNNFRTYNSDKGSNSSPNSLSSSFSQMSQEHKAPQKQKWRSPGTGAQNREKKNTLRNLRFRHSILHWWQDLIRHKCQVMHMWSLWARQTHF